MYKDIFETKYTADNGQSTIIPLSKNWNKIGIQVSGGLDSALLLFLTAKTILDNNLDIQILPISVDVPTKAKNLSSARMIISQVSAHLDANEIILPGKELYMPKKLSTHRGNRKNNFFNKHMEAMLTSKEVDVEFNGNTKNPPEDVRKNFTDNKNARMTTRDNRQSTHNGGLISWSPHALIDKQGIINLYIKYNLVDVLAPHTLSCDQNVTTIVEKKLDIPCGQCWWCDERKWGFESNNILDPAPTLPRIW